MRLVPHMPLFMPPLLLCLEDALLLASPSREALSLAASWLEGCGAALLSALPLFLHPYLPRLLRSLLRLAELSALDSPAAAAAALEPKANAVARAIAKVCAAFQIDLVQSICLSISKHPSIYPSIDRSISIISIYSSPRPTLSRAQSQRCAALQIYIVSISRSIFLCMHPSIYLSIISIYLSFSLFLQGQRRRARNR